MSEEKWTFKGEDGVATSYKEMWDRLMEWARDGWTMPDTEFIRETVIQADAELTRLRESVIIVLHEDILTDNLTSYSRDELLKVIGMQPGPWTDIREAEFCRRASDKEP